MKNIIIYVLALSILSGCICEKELVKEVKHTNSYIPQTICSTYKNKNLGGSHYSNLSDLLFGFHKIKFYENQHQVLDSLCTKLEYDGNKKLQISFLDTNNVEKRFFLKVKNKGEYLSVRRKTFLIPIPFFFFIQRDRKAIIYNDMEGDLIIITGEYQLIWVLFAGGNSVIHENKFELKR